jgi:hypothetical protein
MKREIGALREMMEDRKRELEVELGRDASRYHEDEQENDDVDDDARSTHTLSSRTSFSASSRRTRNFPSEPITVLQQLGNRLADEVWW